MKFSLAVSCLVAGAVAQSSVDIIRESLYNIGNATEGLSTAISSFSGPSDLLALNNASQDVIKVINESIAAVEPLEPISVDDALALQPVLISLNDLVSSSVQTVIDEKDTFVDAKLGTIVYQQLVQQRVASTAFSVATIAKLPAALTKVGIQLSAPIIDAIDKGVAAYQDQALANAPTPTYSDPYSITTAPLYDLTMTAAPPPPPRGDDASMPTAPAGYGAAAMAILAALAPLV